MFVLRVAQAELGAVLDDAFFKRHSTVEGNLFKLVKGAPARPPAAGGVTRLVDGVKRRVKRQLQRF